MSAPLYPRASLKTPHAFRSHLTRADFIRAARLAGNAGFAFVDIKQCPGYLGHVIGAASVAMRPRALIRSQTGRILSGAR